MSASYRVSPVWGLESIHEWHVLGHLENFGGHDSDLMVLAGVRYFPLGGIHAASNPPGVAQTHAAPHNPPGLSLSGIVKNYDATVFLIH